METLENLVQKMESQMDRADSKLDLLTMRLDQFESRVLLPDQTEGNPSIEEKRVAIKENKVEGEDSEKPGDYDEDDDDDGLDPKLVTELLVEVKRVRKEYDQLLQDVHQVQELQHEVTKSLRKQMKQVQNHFDRLRERVIGSSGPNK
ncbi:uncharacterized protein LOC117642511 [Thrips palmi]|uniref:Uncharacterized protein LOC117642511 n=1 Tax=Thrips palmi TaxID=161013 RepID=A0A6P8YI30_THRPL|nr:uncharacterized protein LOC117642511 [Thrips palmi]